MKLQKLKDVATQATQKITTADITDERNRRLLIERYEEWLAIRTRRNTINNALREMNEYAQSAGKTVLVGERKVTIFAPFRPEHSALWVITENGPESPALSKAGMNGRSFRAGWVEGKHHSSLVLCSPQD